MIYKRTWQNKGHRPYWAHNHIMMAGSKFEEITGFRYRNCIYIIDENAHNSSYYTQEEMDKATKHFETYWKEKRDEYFEIIDDFFEKSKRYMYQVFNMHWERYSDDEVVGLLKEIEEIWNFRYIFISNPPHVLPLEKELRFLVGSDEIIQDLIINNDSLPFDDENEEIKELNKIWQNLKEEEKEEKLKGLENRYGWFGGIEGEQPNDKEYYRRLVEEYEEKQKPKAIKHQTSKEAQELGLFIGRLSNIRYWCRYYGMSLRYCMKLCILELEKRWKLKDLEYAMCKEIYTYHKTKTLPDLQIRKKGYTMVLDGDDAELLTGEEAEKINRNVKDNLLKEDKIKGSIGYKGVVKGIARVISFSDDKYHDEVFNFKSGEILITGMTRTQIVALCRKAAAIVTDEGGITSHAATISRELKIPCIVGTGNATDIIKTGDFIEVDANKGVVRKI